MLHPGAVLTILLLTVISQTEAFDFKSLEENFRAFQRLLGLNDNQQVPIPPVVITEPITTTTASTTTQTTTRSTGSTTTAAPTTTTTNVVKPTSLPQLPTPAVPTVSQTAIPQLNETFIPVMEVQCCPIKFLTGCCQPANLAVIQQWLDNPRIPQTLKQLVRMGQYDQVDLDLIQLVPTIIWQRLTPEGIRLINSAQLRVILTENPDDFMAIGNLLSHVQQRYYDVFLNNVKFDHTNHPELLQNVTRAVQQVISISSLSHWGAYERWKSSQIVAFSSWVPELPCYSAYHFGEKELITAVLPAAILGQQRLGQCAKSALFTRLYQSGQLSDVSSWNADKVVGFSYLLDGTAPNILRTLPRSTLQDANVLRTLPNLKFVRAQVEALLSPLIDTTISSEMILAMAGSNVEVAKCNPLLRFIPAKLISSSVIPPVYGDVKVSAALKSVFCRTDYLRAYRTGYQIHWWYRSDFSPKFWTRADIQELGCLAKYLAPLDLSRLDLMQLAQDIEQSYTKNFAGGDFSLVQAKILFNYGRQLLHLGSGSWTTDRFAAIPVSVVPGIPIQKINEFPWEEAKLPQFIDTFTDASTTRLGLSPPQIVALLAKINSIPTGGLRSALHQSRMSTSMCLMKFLPAVRMSDWQLTDFNPEQLPRLSFPQARFWLRRLVSESAERRLTAENIRDSLYPLLIGLDCELVAQIHLADLMPIVAQLYQTDFRPNPEAARCLKDRIVEFVLTFSDNNLINGTEADNSTSPVDSLAFYSTSLIAVSGTAINQQLSGSELSKLSLEACIAAVDSASDCVEQREIQLKIRPRNRRENFISSALKCLHRAQQTRNFRIGLSEAATLKYLLSELPSDMYQRIPDEVFYKNLPYLQGGCLSQAQRKSLRSKLISTLGKPQFWVEEDLSLVGCLVYQLNSTEFDSIPDAALQDYIDYLGVCYDRRHPRTDLFVRQCQQELGDKETEAMESRIHHISSRLALLASRSVSVVRLPLNTRPIRPSINRTPPTPARISQFRSSELIDFSQLRMMNEPQQDFADRYEQPGWNLTCDWFKAAGPHITSLPKETFTYAGNMSAIEFIRCLPDLAQFQWSAEARDSFWERIKREIGTLSPPELESMGTLLLSMTTTELDQLDFSSSLDLLWAFGKLPGWSQAQLYTLAKRFKLTVTPVMSNVDAIQLTAMGHILCGLDSVDIERLNTSAYLDASVAIGELDECNLDVLKSLARLATRYNAYGDVRGWDSGVVATVGIVAAGLTPAELAHLHPAATSGLNCAAMAHLLPAQLQVFSTEQIQNFHMDSAMCVRKEQIFHMSEAQKYAVWEAGSDVLRLKPQNGAERNFLSALLVVTLMLSVIGWQ